MHMKFERGVIKTAVVNAVATAVYITLIANFLARIETIFGDIGPGKEPLIAMFMLTLFVVSAAITGFAVLGRPVMWYLDGKKKEAVALLTATIVVLIAIGLLFALALFL